MGCAEILADWIASKDVRLLSDIDVEIVMDASNGNQSAFMDIFTNTHAARCTLYEDGACYLEIIDGSSETVFSKHDKVDRLEAQDKLDTFFARVMAIGRIQPTLLGDSGNTP